MVSMIEMVSMIDGFNDSLVSMIDGLNDIDGFNDRWFQ
jgi:hypothetical protein